MKNVFDIDDKLYEQNPNIIVMSELIEEIIEFLPTSSISRVVVEYCCKVYLYEKKINGIGWIKLIAILVFHLT